MSNPKLKTWPSRPPNSEVETFIQDYFKALSSGDLETTHDLVTHAYEDWNESIFLLWQDHYLIHEIPKDNSFEGQEWKSQGDWLNDLTIKDTIEWVQPNRLWVDFLFRGEPSGYIGEFLVKETAAGFCMERVIFRMA